ncbi:MAG: acyl-CoA reductase [Bacteroidota bacterium]
MQLQQRINAIVKLGTVLSQLNSENENAAIVTLFEQAKANNGWFSQENVIFACQNWSDALSEENLNQWIFAYDANKFEVVESDVKIIAVVMAGNVPLVGFHDFISVLLSGHKVLVKLSSNDRLLLPYLTKQLLIIEPAFEDYIFFTEEKLEHFDAVIATGSDNTARYFDHYFGKYPNIIRHNRNSVAVLTGKESTQQLEALANDIFRYFGLGCRNVSKIYIPKGYNFDAFFKAVFSWKHVIHDNKYINNYDYNKAVYLMSLLEVLDNEFLLLKEDTGFSSPISVVFYEHYETQEKLKRHLAEHQSSIQCIVSETGLPNEIPFGKAQAPNLWDYADGVDTLRFLLNL